MKKIRINRRVGMLLASLIVIIGLLMPALALAGSGYPHTETPEPHRGGWPVSDRVYFEGETETTVTMEKIEIYTYLKQWTGSYWVNKKGAYNYRIGPGPNTEVYASGYLASAPSATYYGYSWAIHTKDAYLGEIYYYYDASSNVNL